MKAYMFEVRDSDGNNCSVFDVLVSAETREQASEILWKHLTEMYPDDESDGGFGTFHACDCSCEHRKTKVCSRCSDGWECSHGGLLTNEDCTPEYGPQEFSTVADALESHTRLTYYHSLIDLTKEN